MKRLITILLLSFIFTAQAEKQFDLVPITLPYPSLKLEDIYAYNSTILVRSENKIYKSIDDGDTWNIVFESDTKVRQLYSLDAHTIFVVGDSGMAHRTFDYGESWEDISFETPENFTAIAAKDYEDYLILSEQAYIFHKGGEERELLPIKSNSIVPLYTITNYNGNYYYGGGVKLREYYCGSYDATEIKMPYYIFDGVNIKGEIGMNGTATGDLSMFKTDTLKIHTSKYGIYFSAVNQGNAGIILNNDIGTIFFYEAKGKYLYGDNFIYTDEYENNTYIFTREGYLVIMDSDIFINPPYSVTSITDEEKQNIHITPINSVFRTDTNSFIIASNDSRIYKLKINEAITGIEDITKSGVNIFGNILVLDDNTKLLSVYNYMGIPVNYEILSEKVYRLPKGLNFISYIRNDKITTTKVSVVE